MSEQDNSLLSPTEIREICLRSLNQPHDLDIAKLVCHISTIESALDFARTGIGAVLRAKTFRSIRDMSGELELAAKPVDFYKAKGRTFVELASFYKEDGD